MKFKDLCYLNEINDEESGTYTRYIVDINKKINEPVLVSLTTDGKGKAEIKIYKTDLSESAPLGEFLNKKTDKEYSGAIIQAYILNGGDFNIVDKPITEMSSAKFGKNAIINSLHTEDKYCRKGLGSYALNVVQDYYKKTNHIDGNNDIKRIYVARSGFDDSAVYANSVERKMGSFGDLLAHARAKVSGKNSDRAYLTFLDKNNFRVHKHPYCLPTKPIISDRKIISTELLDEENRPAVIQCMGNIVHLQNVLEK